ncbi:MAG: hypothetical protein P8I25_06925 [Ilumatobacter sp.]|nr:hypothetical protein [Ilumatobacter sp.]
MSALTLDAAKSLSATAVIIFLVGSFAAALIMKTIIQKVVVISVLLLLAFSVYSQRASLQDCADKVQGNFTRDGTSVTVTDTECSFFGAQVTITDPRTE